MKPLLAALALTFCSLGQTPAPSLKSVRKIYIEKMDNDLDKYLRAEIVKQFKGNISVVLDAKDADGILAGVNEEQKGTGAKITGRYLGLHDVATGLPAPHYGTRRGTTAIAPTP